MSSPEHFGYIKESFSFETGNVLNPSWIVRGDQEINGSQASVLYVSADQVMIATKRENAIPFDVPNVELGHHRTQYSFDPMIKKYNLTDTALLKMAVIVRGADTNARTWHLSVQDSRQLRGAPADLQR